MDDRPDERDVTAAAVPRDDVVTESSPNGWLRVAATTAGVAAAWAVLTVLRPGVTFHLAPALVAWSVPFVARGTGRWMAAVPTAALGFGAAALTTAFSGQRAA